MGKSKFAARGGVLTALSFALLYIAVLVPFASVGLCAAAGIVPSAVLLRQQGRLGASVYMATAILSLLMLPSKGVVAMYILFGLYTLVKYVIEKRKNVFIRWACKLVFAASCAELILATLHAGLFQRLTRFAMNERLLFTALFLIIFIVYDIAFSQLLGWIERIFSST